MAKRYVLLNNKWYEKLKSLGSDVGPGAAAQGVDHKSIEIINENQTNQDERIMSIVSLIPAQYRNKARLLLSTILPYIHVDSFNRIVYKDDKKTGSSILDLLLYCISPSNIQRPRPLDIPKFARLLVAAGTPTNSYGKGRNIEELAQMGVADGVTANIDLTREEEEEEPEWSEGETPAAAAASIDDGDEDEDLYMHQASIPSSQPPTWKRYY